MEDTVKTFHILEETANDVAIAFIMESGEKKIIVMTKESVKDLLSQLEATE